LGNDRAFYKINFEVKPPFIAEIKNARSYTSTPKILLHGVDLIKHWILRLNDVVLSRRDKFTITFTLNVEIQT